MRRKRIRLIAAAYLLFAAAAIWGFSVGRYEAFPWAYLSPIEKFVLFVPEVEEKPTLVQKLTKHRMETPSLFAADGFVMRDDEFVDPGYLLMSRYSSAHSQTIVELVRLRDFRILHSWIPPVDELLETMFPEQEPMISYNRSRDGFAARHPLLLPDGRIVVHPGLGALFCLDRQSRVVWRLGSKYACHHSIDIDAVGNVIAAGNIAFPGERTWPEGLDVSSNRTFPRDGYFVVSPEHGEVLRSESVADILVHNNFHGLLFGISQRGDTQDSLHLNDVQPLRYEVGEYRYGDLAFSLRDISTVFVYRPSTRKVLWLRTGPWVSQHDVDMLPDGDFTVFSNNSYRKEKEKYREISNVIRFNVKSDEFDAPYDEILREVGSFTMSQGCCRVLPGGDVVFEQQNEGRVFRVSRREVRWEFVNKTRDGYAGWVNWCRYYLASEIDLSWLERVSHDDSI
ncbi:arylsulfotransferase family protein [Stratiformator vulcanicus]|uniref:Arylsulfotransferase (ASST) n=1 Tax=Stratiformator vulcanicus TaxID=2527980 RepID=A0A517R6E2_9PLAN|nr:arylsulfotransferase family protein [Stratiformator vulcanicus]QDT39467.1 hypothetical protein Pan189_38750 [Stratiformator vulcanicus]